MLKTIVVLPDGTKLTSGAGTKNAIKSITVTQCVNEGQELTLGSACSNMIELSVITPGGGFSIAEGDEFAVYREDDRGKLRKVGLFISEKPVRTSPNHLKITAYDRVSRLDRDLTGWLAGLNRWPYTLEEFARMTCQQCGLELYSGELPNGAYPVQKFSAQGITGRTIMKWVGQIAGRFCRASADGLIEFAWYSPCDTAIGAGKPSVTQTPEGVAIYCPGVHAESQNGNAAIWGKGIALTYDGDGNVRITLPDGSLTYCQGGLHFSDYTVEPVKKVQIQCSVNDVGTVYPENIPENVSTYIIANNYLLTSANAHTLKPIAQSLYEQLQQVRYTPCTVKLPAGFHICAGNTVEITDRNGVTFTAYVMTKKQEGQLDILECTGSPSRTSTSAVNQVSYQTLHGKILDLSATVDGLRLENRDAAGKMAAFALDTAGISSQVQRQQADMQIVHQQLTQLRQSESAMELRVKSVEEQGVQKVTTETGFTFDEKGLTISKAGTQMENLLDETGMFVKRSGKVILQADQEGVAAADVSVRNYLIVGDHARFEDYGSNRTACFWI